MEQELVSNGTPSRYLTQLSDVKGELTTSGSAADAVLTDLIGSASSFIEKYCNRYFAVGVFTERIFDAKSVVKLATPGLIKILSATKGTTNILSSIMTVSTTTPLIVYKSLFSTTSKEYYYSTGEGDFTTIQYLAGYLPPGQTYTDPTGVTTTTAEQASILPIPAALSGICMQMVRQAYVSIQFDNSTLAHMSTTTSAGGTTTTTNKGSTTSQEIVGVYKETFSTSDTTGTRVSNISKQSGYLTTHAKNAVFTNAAFLSALNQYKRFRL